LTEEIKNNLLIIDKSVLAPDGINCSTLAEEGFEVTTVPDPTEALARLSELKPDLIILGEGLAEDSFKVCFELRQAVDIPVFMLGSMSRSRGWVKAIKAGADTYLARPVSQAELIARLKATLRRRQWACS
jgi:DNA-binding response OmpR family regulator